MEIFLPVMIENSIWFSTVKNAIAASDFKTMPILHPPILGVFHTSTACSLLNHLLI